MAKATPIPLGNTPSLAGQLVVVIGGHGLIGHYTAQALMAMGARLRIACRHAERAYSLKPLGKVGQMQVVPCDITKPATVEAALTGADAVVNLAGVFGRHMDAVIADGAANVAKAAREQGLSAMVQVSAIGADPASPAAYGRAKAAGEAAVKEHFPGATIIRPSIIAAEDGGFIPMLAKKIADFAWVPVFAPDRVLAPVFADDCAKGITNALADAAQHGGKCYEVAGPEQLSMLELSEKMAALQGRKRRFISLSDGMASFISHIPFTPITHDQWLMLKQGNVPQEGALGLADLGVDARPLSLFLGRWMESYRKHGRFTPVGALPGSS